MKLVKGLPQLKQNDILKKFQDCLRKVKSMGLRVNEFSLLSNHIHLILEADSNEILGKGMRFLNSSFAKILRKLAGGKGRVFQERYHLHVLKTPREVRNALRYVLLNQAKHEKLLGYLDQFSSAFSFKHWKRLVQKGEAILIAQIEDFVPRVVDYLSEPKSWLGSTGWMKSSR